MRSGGGSHNVPRRAEVTKPTIWNPNNFVGTGGGLFKMGLGEVVFGCQVRVRIRSGGAQRCRCKWSGPGGGEGNYHRLPSPRSTTSQSITTSSSPLLLSVSQSIHPFLLTSWVRHHPTWSWCTSLVSTSPF